MVRYIVTDGQKEISVDSTERAICLCQSWLKNGTPAGLLAIFVEADSQDELDFAFRDWSEQITNELHHRKFEAVRDNVFKNQDMIVFVDK